MTGKLPFLLLMAPALLHGRETSAPEEQRKLSLSEVLEPNSVLSGVMLPRYDHNLHLTSVLRAKSVTLVDREVLDGESVNIRLYQADRSSRGTVELAKARYHQGDGKVRATGPTKLVFGRISTTANGLFLTVDSAEGFLTGPVATRLAPAPSKATTMNPRVAPFRASALLGTALLTQSLVAAPAPAVATEAPAAPSEAVNRDNLRAALEASAEATRAATAYLEQENLLAQSGSATVPYHEPKAVAFQEGPEDTVIKCDTGTYVDGEKGVLVYLGNVTVTNPEYSLKGANELKAFFTKVPDAPAPAGTAGEAGKPATPATAKPASAEAALVARAADKVPIAGELASGKWELDRIVASGAVYFRYLKAPAKEGEVPIEASGAIFTYHAKTKTATLSGGQPWVRKGGVINQANLANQTITIVNDTATFSPGGTKTILPTKELELQKDKPKAK